MITFLCQAPLQAAPGTLATSPLYLSTAVDPNIVFLTDDSGSMDWTLLTSESDGVIWLSGLPYYYSIPAPDNDYFWTVASEDYLLSIGVPAPALGVWRTRNADYNRLYYNPTVTYTPWKGVDTGGIPFANSNPGAALVNPYYPSAGTVDLTSPTSYGTDYPTTGFITVTNYFPARYYTWTDTDGNGLVDAADGHTRVEIRPTTPTYTGAAGRTDCAAAPVCTYAEEIQNFANWFSYYRKREFSAKNAVTAVVADMSSARVGYGTINNNNSVKIKVAAMNPDVASGNKRALYDKVFQANSAGGTPLRTNLRDVGRYFECASGNFFGVSGTNCPILDAASGGTCQQNFTILMTDGYYNGWSPALSPSNTDGDNNTAFDGGSYADSSTDTLADVAMHYYERDLMPGLSNVVPTTPGVDDANHQHMVTYTVAFGVTGTLDPFDTKTPGVAADTDPADSGFSWPSPFSGNAQKIDDLWHTAYNGRGKFLSAQDPAQLSTSLTDALSDIVGRTSSAAAVAFNSTTLGTDSVVYQARFNSSSWSGELLARALDPLDGSVASTPIWNAGTVLDGLAPASRLILTYKRDPSIPANSAGIPFKTLSSLSTTQQTDLNTGPTGSDGQGQARIDYLRGERTNEGAGLNFRTRSSVLGDIVHSNPIYVGQPPMNYPDADPFGTATDRYSGYKTAQAARSGVIYVGANDGMLHGFAEGNGAEVIAYVPDALFSSAANTGLHYLSDPNYAHRYYVDQSPTVADAYIRTSPGGAVGWKTVLTGGLRGGGRGLFALDVTDPGSFSESTADDIVMWEFTATDDADLGATFSDPTIAILNNNRWAAIFGNGYNDTGSGEAKLFILYLDGGLDGAWTAGTDYLEITTGVGAPADPNGLATPGVVDLDGNGTADRVYAGDLQGNLWAFDLSSANPTQWDVAYKQGSTPKPLFTATVSGIPQPITTKPVAVKHPSMPPSPSNAPNLLVFFGTGQFLVESDKTTTGTESLYGVWDRGTKELLRGNLVPQGFESGFPADVRVPTNVSVDYNLKFGWNIDLPASGERMVVNPKIRGQLVFFNTLIPETAPCTYGGSGWLMVVKQINGGRPDNPVYDYTNDGTVDSADLLSKAGSDYAPGGIKFTAGIPAESNFLGKNQYTPGSGGEIQKDVIDDGTGSAQGRLSWQEIRN